MIRFGPAGIPLSCKGRTLRDGISDAHHLGLTAMEVQFIKVNPLTRVVLDEEVGKPARTLPLQLVVEAGSEEPMAAPTRPALENPLKRRDSLTTLTWSLAKDLADLDMTRNLARALDVDLTLHAPYYVDFFGSDEARERSMRQIQWASVLADGLGARLAVTHLGFYGGGDRGDSVQELTQIATDLSAWLREFSGGRVRLGVEPSGHPDIFGSREEVLELARRVKGVVPVLNLPHLAAREKIPLDKPGVLQPIVEEFVKASGGDLYANFSGVELYGLGEFRLTPIKRGQLKFDTIAEVVAEREYDATVISSSPLLEHDAMYMKLLYERALSRRWAKRHPPTSPPPPPVKKAAPPARGAGPSHPRSSSKKPGPSERPRPRPASRSRGSGGSHGRKRHR
ncbi:MAG: TIM barrel protein [Thermoplasmata archaeon]|nr:TIM barrel protein [Thermoplasmata archaeon]